MRFLGVLLLLLMMTMEIYAAVNKKNKTQRDPFVRATQLILTKENLQDYPLDTLKLMGTICQNSQALAIVRDPKNHLYTLKLGDSIGLEHAKITYIADGKIGIEWVMQQQIFTDYLVVSTE